MRRWADAINWTKPEKRRRRESNPRGTALQAVAGPFGFSVMNIADFEPLISPPPDPIHTPWTLVETRGPLEKFATLADPVIEAAIHSLGLNDCDGLLTDAATRESALRKFSCSSRRAWAKYGA